MFPPFMRPQPIRRILSDDVFEVIHDLLGDFTGLGALWVEANRHKSDFVVTSFYSSDIVMIDREVVFAREVIDT